MFVSIRGKFDNNGDVFKQTKDWAQFLKQGEIDIVGVDQKGGIHAMEVAFHESGLYYGGGTDNRVLKKLLRTLMILHAYQPCDARFSIYFVSPKVNPGVQKLLDEVFGTLRAEYPAIEWHLLTNQNFTEQIVRPTLQRSGVVADTSELFVRAAKLLELTDIRPPNDVRQARLGRPLQETGHVPVPSVSAEKLQPLVQDLMNTLLVGYPPLLDETGKRKLLDREYCKRVVGLQIGNLPLLRRVEDEPFSDKRRYYADPYGGFYVCSQWWKSHHVDNARSLLKFVTELSEKMAGKPNVAQLTIHENAFRDYIKQAKGPQGV